MQLCKSIWCLTARAKYELDVDQQNFFFHSIPNFIHRSLSIVHFDGNKMIIAHSDDVNVITVQSFGQCWNLFSASYFSIADI